MRKHKNIFQKEDTHIHTHVVFEATKQHLNGRVTETKLTTNKVGLKARSSPKSID